MIFPGVGTVLNSIGILIVGLITRLFVKKVLSDLWIYRDRFEQNKVSLWELANNRWPKYLRMEN